MDATEICFTPAVALAAAIRDRQLSPLEITEAVLRRIEAVNPIINAYCTVVADQELEQARQAERQVAQGGPLGALHGVPVSFKDLTLTAGIRTTFGSKIFEHHVPTVDAAIVERTRAAGAILLGKTNSPEFGCKGTTDNRVFGATRNPWNPAMTANGSSGGAAAALTAGLGPLAEGSDLAGSIRMPAAACGVVGLKPSPGRLPRFPAPSAWNALSVNGPMARTVRDTALFFNMLCGPDERDLISLPSTGEDFLAACNQPLPRLRVAWTPDLGYAPIHPTVAAIGGAAAQAFTDLGCTVKEAHPGFPNPHHLFIRLTAPMRAAATSQHLERWRDQMDPILVSRLDQAATSRPRSTSARSRSAPNCGTPYAASSSATTCC